MPLKKNKKKYFSPFPSPGVYTSRRSYTAIYPINKPRKSNKRRRQLRNRQNILSHLSKAREMRLKQAVEQSVRSHIDRLTEHRRKSMLQSDLPYFPFVAHPVFSCTSSCTIPKRHFTTKKAKKIKKQEIRNINLEQLESNSHSLELEIKKIMESVQIFEKQKQEFLSNLSKIQAKISSLSLTQPVYEKEIAENDEKIKVKRISSQTIKSTKTASSKLKKKTVLRSKNKTHTPQNIIDNLSKMLINTQRPSKTETNTATQGTGLMNLAQAFCTMATGF